jgi:hypothetical protein
VNWGTCFLACYIALTVAGEPQTSAPDGRTVVVPAHVAALVRPILDEKEGGLQQGESKLSKLLYGLTQEQGQAADEALVVLMCFDLGESQEEIDAVIARGRKMLPLLKKYQKKNPKIPERNYPDAMLKGTSSKADAFAGAVRAIKHGWHSTGDDPEG